MKSNKIFSQMKNKDWKNFNKFTKEKLVKSFISNKKFNKFWFYKKKNWSVQIMKRSDETISLINMTINTRCKFINKIIPFTWASTAYADKDVRSKGVFGLMMYNLNKKLPLLGLSCGNKNSLPINQAIGKEINGLKKMRRFIYVSNKKCNQIVQKKYRNLLNKFFYKNNTREDKKIFNSISKFAPKDLGFVWNKFSKKFTLCIYKDYKYIKWRYESCPFQKYSFLIFRDSKKKLLGLSIIRFQKTSYGECARIVDFISLPKYEKKIWDETINICVKKNVLFIDFIVVGTAQDKNLFSSGFLLADDKNNLNKIPNLLSPIEYRDWSYSFHIGGYLAKKTNWNFKNKVWFTKGDGDRDWPTPNDI